MFKMLSTVPSEYQNAVAITMRSELTTRNLVIILFCEAAVDGTFTGGLHSSVQDVQALFWEA